jgi:hypothetical protein
VKKTRQPKYELSPLGELKNCPLFHLAFVCQRCLGGYFFGGADRCTCSRAHKFGALRVKIFHEGKWELFDSMGEAERWSKLVFLEKNSVIQNLTRSKKYPFEINGVKITWYESDYEYQYQGADWTEDFKGKITKEFRIKAALMKALYPNTRLVLTKRSKVSTFRGAFRKGGKK